MKTLSKLIALMLISALIVSIFAGCVVKTETTTPKETTSGTTKPAEEKPITISIKYQAGSVPVDPNSPVIKLINEKFNVKIEPIHMDRTNETELLNLRIASGDIPDVMSLTSGNLPVFRDQGVLAKIPLEKVKQLMPTFYQVTTKNAGGEHVWKIYRYKEGSDDLCALPALEISAKYHMVPIWRDDWLNNVGITKIPETIEEAEEAWYRFVKNDPDQNGKADTFAMSQRGMWAVYGAYGGTPPDVFTFWKKADNGDLQLYAVNPLAKQAVEKLRKYYKDGLIDPEFITGENKGQYYYNSPPFWNGIIGFTVGGQWYHFNPPLFDGDLGSGNYQNFKQLQGEKATYAEGKPLKGPGGMGIVKWQLISGYGLGLGKQVANDPKKMEKIMEIYEAYHKDEEVYLLVHGGIKGETYYLDNGLIKYPESLTKDQEKFGSLGLGMIGFLSNNFDMRNKFGQRKEVIEYTNRVANYTSNWENPIVAGALPSSGQYSAPISKKIQEAYQLFITGQKSMEEWDAFVNDLYKSGLDVLTEEANKWYNEYYK
ncbi:MAG: hypothetical protein HPY74_02075 [Firmicutes bacterium]|nr:hypothetical protein [Bacillota bacterium]